MHCLCSQGVANIEVQQLVNMIRGAGYTLRQLDGYSQRFKLPHGRSMPQDFFQQRCAPTSDVAHSFASETLTALPILRSFGDLNLRPRGLVTDYLMCFEKLCLIAEILQLCDGALAHRDMLQETIIQHHDMFVTMYPDCAKPKLHYLLHIV